jgi:uncharacterized protein YndB with AHSA1/START domain
MRRGTYDVTLERVLDAPPEVVFDAYVDPAAGRVVFAGAPDWNVEVACDLRVGGLWTIASAAPDGGLAYHETNRFTAIDRAGHVAFESTMLMPDGSRLERDVDVTLQAVEGGGTRMTILQLGFANQEIGDQFAAAFPGVFDRLEQQARARLARRGSPA